MIELSYDNDTRKADIARNGANIVTSDLLDTAVAISLFTRRRADATDDVPDTLSHREGWWADRYPNVDGDLIGSRLWLLGRDKTTQATLNRAKTYAREALQWMVDDGIAESIEVEVERQKISGTAADGMLAFRVGIIRKQDQAARYERFWNAHLALL